MSYCIPVTVENNESATKQRSQNMSEYRSLISKEHFTSELRYWSKHAAFCSSPSFILAIAYGDFNSVSGVTGMLLGIATMIVAFAVISSTSLFTSQNPQGIFRRSVRMGASIRSVISAIGLIGAVYQPLVLLALPDIWSGLLAIFAIKFIFQGITGPDFWVGTPDGLIPTYATTILEGLIISVTLLFIALIVSGILQLRAKVQS